MYAAHVCVKCLRQMLASNVGGLPKYMRQMLASNLCRVVKYMRHIIYDIYKPDVEISAPIKNIWAKCMHPSENLRPNFYYLGSAESPTSDFFQVWLKSSRSGDVASPSCGPQVIWAPRPASLYGRHLSRSVLDVVPARLAKISASCPNICGRIYFHHFLGKNQKPISAYKCPIISLQIRTWSQKLSKFCCNTFKPLIRGHPRFWPRTLKTVQIQQWGVRGWRGGEAETDAAGLLIALMGGGWEGGGAGRGENKYVLALNAACMHLLLHYVSLSHISVLLLQPLSI